MNYLSNAISLNMFEIKEGIRLIIKPCTPANVPEDIISKIGHENTAQDASRILGRTIPFNREPVQLAKEDTLYIFQYIGDRLPEGATELPPDAKYKIYLVKYE
ncbi:DUF1874 domain-containing protein [bacterium]|nr:DUF1874 domain-containing protein [bacterium]